MGTPNEVITKGTLKNAWHEGVRIALLGIGLLLMWGLYWGGAKIFQTKDEADRMETRLRTHTDNSIQNHATSTTAHALPEWRQEQKEFWAEQRMVNREILRALGK